MAMFSHLKAFKSIYSFKSDFFKVGPTGFSIPVVGNDEELIKIDGHHDIILRIS